MALIIKFSQFFLLYFALFNGEDERVWHNEGEQHRQGGGRVSLVPCCSFAYQLPAPSSCPAIKSHYLGRQPIYGINYVRVKRMKKEKWNKSADESSGQSIFKPATYTFILVWRSLNWHTRNAEKQRVRNLILLYVNKPPSIGDTK